MAGVVREPEEGVIGLLGVGGAQGQADRGGVARRGLAGEGGGAIALQDGVEVGQRLVELEEGAELGGCGRADDRGDVEPHGVQAAGHLQERGDGQRLLLRVELVQQR